MKFKRLITIQTPLSWSSGRTSGSCMGSSADSPSPKQRPTKEPEHCLPSRKAEAGPGCWFYGGPSRRVDFMNQNHPLSLPVFLLMRQQGGGVIFYRSFSNTNKRLQKATCRGNCEDVPGGFSHMLVGNLWSSFGESSSAVCPFSCYTGLILWFRLQKILFLIRVSRLVCKASFPACLKFFLQWEFKNGRETASPWPFLGHAWPLDHVGRGDSTFFMVHLNPYLLEEFVSSGACLASSVTLQWN